MVVRPYDERVKGAIYNTSLLLGGDGLHDVAPRSTSGGEIAFQDAQERYDTAECATEPR